MVSRYISINSNQRGWESPARPSAGPSAYGVAQKQSQTYSLATPATEAPLNTYRPAAPAPAPQAPANAYGQAAPATVTVPSSISPSYEKEAAAAPAALRQICTCITIPDVPKAPEVTPAKTEMPAAAQSYGAAPAGAQKPAYGAAPVTAAPATTQQPAYSSGPATSAYQRPAVAAYPAATTAY